MRAVVRAALSAAGLGAGAIAAAFIGPHEGLSLTAYQDSVGVWTLCRGHTEGVRPGDTATRAECEALFASEVGRVLADVDDRIVVDIPDASLAALTSLCFNTGLGTCAPVLRRVNAGRLGAACDAIALYVYAGGRDCRDPASNCRGIVERRAAERELCHAGRTGESAP
ncbi:lysozyme [Roseospira marina]|uniref:Lysozyme n=1 Tax=Roseospira marina TaxID=140057 RepID=A0A5M6IEZ0_9PROT|nr:lysozyme [Roseospira marina]KAA5606841.1 lysozyme [Roseospira marina]MBB4312997.1 lysozyme [Roseospira marina]MBB5086230.1 lysozyme [Roseospira marina]